MTNLASNSNTDSAFVPSTFNPFLSAAPLEPSQNTDGALGLHPQMMPVIPELSGVGLDAQGNEQRSTAGEGRLGERSQAVLQALANELTPIYPQVAKALTDPSLDSALQSGVGLFSRGSQLIESTMDSGKLMAIAKASDVGSSVRELVDGALAQWQAENNPLRNGLNQQTQALVSDLKVIAAEVDDSDWMDNVKRRLAVARKQVEGFTDGVFTSLGYVGDASIGKNEAAMEQATQRLQKTLVDFRNSSDFTPTLKTAFGNNGQTAQAEALVDDLIAGADGPAIEIVDAQLLLGDGAFGNNTIFISDEVVAKAAENAETLDDVLLEEVGHYFDQALNTVDSAGDEGEIFARLVQGEDISTAEMLALKGENDHSTLTVNDTTINVENRAFLGGSANQAFTAPPVASAHPLTIPTPTPATPTPATPTPVSGSDRRLYLQAGTVDKFDAAVKVQSQSPTPAPTPTPTPAPTPAPTTVSQPAPEWQTPSEPAGGTGTVEVKVGDTLSAIASQHGVQWTDLRKPDGTSFTETEARGLQIGADVVLPNQPAPAPTPAPTPTPAPVTPPPAAAPASPAPIQQKAKQLQDDAAIIATASPYAAQAMQEEAQALIAEVPAPAPTPTPAPVTPPVHTPVTPPVPASAPASPAAIRQKVTQLQDDAEVLATASPYAAEAMQQEAQALIEEEEQRVAEAERVAAAEKRQEAKERREKIAQLTADAELLATASPYAAQAMNAEAQALIAETPAPDPQQLKKDAELLATASPYAAQAMNEQADELIAQAEKEKTQQLFDDAELLATASPYAAQAMQAEAEERAAEEQAAEEEANGDSLSKIKQLQRDAELLATASPYASQAMQAEAEVLIMAEEKRQNIQRLQSDAELLATASPYASQVMQAEAEALIAEDQLPKDQLPKIEQLQQDAELLATASPYAAQAMQAEAEELIEEEERQRIQQLQEDAELLATASPYASQAMQTEVDEWLAEERRQEIVALNQVDGQGLEHRFMGTHPEAAELLGTGNYADNFLSGFELDLVAAEQAANDHNGNDNQVMLQSIFDPVVADKRTIIDEYSVQVELPEGVAPNDILLNLATDMDGFLGGEFADLGDFKNQGETPVPGQVIDIDVKDGMRIFGWKPWGTESPFNAPVMITEIEDTNFTVQTIKYNNVEHLLHGTREWGYELMPDGSVKFYTRGISVEDIQAAEGILWIDGAQEGEYRFWNAQVDGIENYVTEQGGSVVEGSRVSTQTEGPSGNDIWETLTAQQQEMTRQRQIEELERELAEHLEETKDARRYTAKAADQRTRAIRAEIEGWENR